MGVIVNKENSKNNELTRRIDADLRVKAAAQSAKDDPDYVADAEYMKDLKKTGRFGWVWIVLIVLAVISLISIILI